MKYFITGTDTNIGKTYVTCRLIDKYKKRGLRCLGLKPIASGCKRTPFGLRNEDALLLQKISNVKVNYKRINPIQFKDPIAPHIAAKNNRETLSVKKIIEAIQPGLSIETDLTCIEGAGGWLTPLNDEETYADLVKELNFPVILVVGMRLGCLNHALLTVQNMQSMGVKLVGWVANCIEPELPELKANIETLEKMILSPRMLCDNIPNFIITNT